MSRVSHEMRTPLNAVLGFAQLLRMQHETGQPVSSEYTGHILNAGQHLLALVDDVLGLQRAADGSLSLQISSVELDAFLTETIGLMEPAADDRAVQLTRSPPGGLSVRADPTRLRQIILNLGSNAIKYNSRGGSVFFDTRATDSGMVEISIRDRGIGMTGEQLQHLYEPFNRLGREALAVPGVGLGMVITRTLVDRMSGTMVVESEVDAGTCVTIGLPRAD